jgi:protein phosphatase
MTVFRAGLRSDTGQVRSTNQDLGVIGTSAFAVADGMGGHVAGEVASRMAIDSFSTQPIDPLGDLLDRVQDANHSIYERSTTESELRGMGTTLCAVALVRTGGIEQLVVANVGDSRVYVLEHNQLRQITRDHSFVEDLVAAGEISPEEARNHPNRNILTRALGIEATVDIDTWELYPFAGDRYLLCSDGLFNEVDDPTIAEALRTIEDPQEAADVLVRLANERGGHDNITVMVVDVVEGVTPIAEEEPEAEPETGGWLGDEAIPELDDTVPRQPIDHPEPLVVKQPKGPRPARFTWRVAAFLVVLIAVASASAVSIGLYARSGYTVTLQNNEVIAQKGRPGGLLWFRPTFEKSYHLTSDRVPAKDVPRLRDGQHYGTLAAADQYVTRLKQQRDEQSPPPTPTSPATTTPPPPPTTTALTATAPPTTATPTTRPGSVP